MNVDKIPACSVFTHQSHIIREHSNLINRMQKISIPQRQPQLFTSEFMF